jgi:hypothetical protein
MKSGNAAWMKGRMPSAVHHLDLFAGRCSLLPAFPSLQMEADDLGGGAGAERESPGAIAARDIGRHLAEAAQAVVQQEEAAGDGRDGEELPRMGMAAEIEVIALFFGLGRCAWARGR